MASQASMQQAFMQGPRDQRVIGDYVVTQWIGAGSFAVVWKGRHKPSDTVVAIKEIPTDKLNAKLQESLESEMAILKRTNHPNIIRLLEIIKAPNRIFLVLEYCAGGDLSDYIRRTGRVKEVTAKYLMQQLGSGLQVLRAHNLIHRDLKPQNLLLSSRNDNAVLKIADFGFARSLQPQGLAETLCGSPLYMAPEILQYQKYDAKADLWSVGAILFELVTGRPPFGGQNHMQLLRNIERSEAVLPPNVAAELSDSCISLCKALLKRNPVERLTFEEFFNHSFLVTKSNKLGLIETATDKTSSTNPNQQPIPSTTPLRKQTSANKRNNVITAVDHMSSDHRHGQDDCLPFALDDEHPGSTSPGALKRDLLAAGANPNSDAHVRPPHHDATHDLDARISEAAGPGGHFSGSTGTGTLPRAEGDEAGPCLQGKGSQQKSSHGVSREGSEHRKGGMERTRSRGDVTDFRESEAGACQRGSLPETTSTDSMECIEREYVVVDAPLRMSSEPVSPPLLGPLISWGRSRTTPARRTQRSPSPSPPALTPCLSVPVSAPVPIAVPGPSSATESLGSQSSTPSSHESGEIPEGPSTHPPTRLAFMQRSATVISLIASEKLESQQPLEALALQLLALAIWREALEVGHAWAAAATDGESLSSCPTEGSQAGRSTMSISCAEGPRDDLTSPAAAIAACATVEREFLHAVEKAEAIGQDITSHYAAEMPDAVELVYQSALTIGRASAVEELMGKMSEALIGYAKAVDLFQFILIEGPALPLKPPLLLSAMDRYRLRRYIDGVVNRQNQCMVLSAHSRLGTHHLSHEHQHPQQQQQH